MVNAKLFELSKPIQFVNLLGCIGSISEEATLNFDESGIKVEVMDNSNVAMMMLEIPKDFFDSWSGWVGSIGFNLKDMLKTLGKIQKEDELYASFDPETTKVLFTFKGHKFLTRNKTITTLDVIAEEIPHPKIFFKSKTGVLLSAFKFAVDDLAKTSEHITFKVDVDVMELSASGDLSSDTIPFISKGDNVIQHQVDNSSDIIKATFTTSYLTDVLKEFNKVSEVVTIECDTDMPLKIDVKLKTGRLEFFLAPCIGIY